MSELLFECYDVPSIIYGIDSLFSFSHGKTCDTGLIVSFGYHSIHIIPVIRGKAQHTQIRRINIGGFHIINFLHRQLQLKYPIHVNAITISRVEWLLHNHCSVAYDYAEELRQWAKLDFYEQNVQKIQLPYAMPVNANASTLTGNLDSTTFVYFNWIKLCLSHSPVRSWTKKREEARTGQAFSGNECTETGRAIG